MSMPCRVGLPAAYVPTSWPSVGQRQANGLEMAVERGGVGVVDAGWVVVLFGRVDEPACGRGVVVEAVRRPSLGYSRSRCPG